MKQLDAQAPALQTSPEPHVTPSAMLVHALVLVPG
jgi:hypothetical protein